MRVRFGQLRTCRRIRPGQLCQGRLFWPSDFRDEVLARLLAAELHADEVRRGVAPGMKGSPANSHDEEEA
jgi:hypothetical protein